MQKAETVLSILKQKSKQDESYRYDRVYRNLFNEDFFLRAYQKIHAKQGNMTPGTDGTTIDGFSRKQICQLIELLKWERYQPKPVRRTYIPKKNGKMRPLGIPAFADKLVQEVVRQILEAIYEPIFSDNSHGFRPNRSCHTALYQIKSTCRGTNWVIEGDITGCFDHTQSPETFKGGAIWSVITSIHGALQAIGYALLVLFFVIGVMKTCGSFAEVNFCYCLACNRTFVEVRTYEYNKGSRHTGTLCRTQIS